MFWNARSAGRESESWGVGLNAPDRKAKVDLTTMLCARPLPYLSSHRSGGGHLRRRSACCAQLPSDNSVKQPADEAILARIQKARQYKTNSDVLPQNAQQDSAGRQGTSNVGSAASPASTADAGSVHSAGNAQEAASFLQGVAAGPAKLDAASMRPETYTRLKEEARKEQGAEIISIDGSYNPAGDSTKYKPKVATWGVFPRPDNISQAFGGGRNIKPGEPLESEEVAAARRERLAQALQRYKQLSGLNVDPAVEAASQRAYDSGMVLLQAGRLEAALAKFTESAEAMALRSKLGGEARLQKAICLDSLGRGQEALVIYKQIRTHSSAAVARQAKHLMFGFEAMDNLKTHTISYAPSKAEWDPYFNKLSGSYNTSYVASEEDAENLAAVTVFATLVMLAPFAFLAVKVLKLA